MNYSPILCPVCNNKLTYIYREVDNLAPDFHSIFCFNPAVKDKWARDSHTLFNLSPEWEIQHFHIDNGAYKLNQDTRTYIIDKSDNDNLIFNSNELPHINWLSLDSINNMITILLTFK